MNGKIVLVCFAGLLIFAEAENAGHRLERLRDAFVERFEAKPEVYARSPGAMMKIYKLSCVSLHAILKS